MIHSKFIQTPALKTHYFESGDTSKDLVLLLHGNVSSSAFFKPFMEKLDSAYHYVAPDLRGYGDSETKAVDATKGVMEFSEDLHHFLNAINPQHKKVHLLGWSLGGGVLLQLATDHPQDIASLILESPMSPFGFGASINSGLELKKSDDDFAGSGGGAVNPAFIDSIRTQDEKTPSTQAGALKASPQFYARSTMNGLYFKMINGQTLLQRGIFDQATEDAYTESMFKTKLGETNYPGNSQPTAHWPGMAPGDKGVNNAISAKYCNLTAFAYKNLTIPVLWIRGADDLIVSDTSFLDVNNLGKMGLIPGWPGNETHPPQPMVTQMRALLEAYQKNGGSYTEVVLADCGHSPHIEQEQKFKELIFDFITKA
jgi:pimeloyl-ACP methyl ester carboxylesterase